MQAKVVQALFVAYFTEGRDVGDPAVLEKIGVEAGMPAEVAASALDDADLHAEIVSLEALAQRSQINGVPTFIFDRRTGFSGAQPLESFLQVIDALTVPAQ
jgi:predicted DsbA family dithiol-disulfide isomerase